MSQSITEENDIKVDFTTPKLNKKRLNWTLAIAGTSYVGASTALYNSWYKDYPRSSFHFHNDFKEWRGVDKIGHGFSAYFQSEWAYKGLRWTGLKEKNAIWLGAAAGLLSQTTIEVMDGFSAEWGFSVADFSANVVGAGGFALQQSLWNEQRIRFKSSSTPINYTERYGSSYFEERAHDIYGSGFATRYLKDYNAQTNWLSLNIKSFFPKSPLPDWLNVAVGYGAENMFGGFSNQFDTDIPTGEIKRYSQFYISLDADLSKIDTDSPILRTLLDVVNVLKMPFSTLEINTLGEVKFYALRF